jgi:hypothetical protein
VVRFRPAPAGLLGNLNGRGYFLTGLNISMGFTKSVTGSWSFGSFMTQVFGHLILALWLIKGAPNIARFIYPEPPPQKEESALKPSDADTPAI